MRQYLRILVILNLILSLTLSSCEKSNHDDIAPIASGKQRYYITNEGAFGYGNSSISVYSPAEKTISNRAFESRNGFGPGDVAQSIYNADNKLFILVNASNKIIVTDSLLNEIMNIDNISLPRYMVSISEHQAAVSCWGDGGVLRIINTQTYALTNIVMVGNGPEKMLISNDRIYVCNSGGFQSDSTVSVVETSSLQVKNLTLNDNPVDVVSASDMSIWILCQGRIIYDASWQPVGETKGALVEINPKTNSVVQTIDLPDGAHPNQLEISLDKKILYFGGGYGFTGIFTFNINTLTLSSTPLIDKEFYGFNIEPKTGNLFCLEAPVFTSSGRLMIYTPSGNLLSESKTGIGPNGVLF